MVKVLGFILFFSLFFSKIFISYASEQLKALEYKERIAENYNKLSKVNFNLNKSIEIHCSNNFNNIIEIKKIYYEYLYYWTSLQHIRFGPINDFNNYARIQFWPDKRGVVNRQYLKTIDGKKSDYIDHGSLAIKSVAVQGLPILERLIFDETERDLSYKCKYMLAVSKNLETIIKYSYDIWATNEKFAEYVEDKEIFSELYNSTLVQLEFIIKNKLSIVEKKNNINIKKLEFWRSAYSIKSLENNLLEIDYFYRALVRDKLIKVEYLNINELENLFINIKNLLQSMDISTKTEMINYNNLKKLLELKEYIILLHSRLLIDVSNKLSVKIGFNRMDGD